MTDLKNAEMLFGALVSDAACLGTHWIYEPERIAEINAHQNGQCAFTPVDAANYEGVKGYFAHGARCNGMQTQIGEGLRLTLHTMNANNGAFDAPSFQTAFAQHFGAGGKYQGYIDGPTKGTLANITAENTPTGIDDDQTPALIRLPAIMAAYHDKPELAQMLETALQVTHVNPVASAYSAVFADLLTRVMQDNPLQDALNAAAANADPSIKDDLQHALSTSESNSTDFAGIKGMMGRACGLPYAGPVMFHILKHSSTYTEAIERNILAGGDNAGRSIMIGAVMARVHGVATPTGVPLDWTLQLSDAANIWSACKQLAQTV